MSEETDLQIDLQFAIYVSRATVRHTAARLQDLSDRSATKNATLNVTGLLLTVGDHFVQILEGERKTILKLLSQIQKDTRHTDFRLIYLRPADRRSFAQWSMRCISLDDKFYLGFEDMVAFRDSVRHLVGNQDAHKDEFSSLVQLLPGLLSRYKFK